MNPAEALIRAGARRYGIDPLAALAVASVEGGVGYGGVGDHGTSFGPFQLHVGGALPHGRNAGWANSPQGIDYALSRIAASGARGLTGRAAVDAIVRNFERPADPGSEIVRAFARYGGQQVPGTAPGNQAAAAPAVNPSPAAGAAAPPPSVNVGAILNQGARAVGLPTLSAKVFTAVQNPDGQPVQFARVHGARPSPHEDHVVQLAKQFIGTPYKWGGASPGGFDCSGFVSYLASKQGVNIGRTTYQQFKEGTPVGRGQLKPGDVVFFEPSAAGPGHEALYIGGGSVIAAPHTGSVVQIQSLSGLSKALGYVGARRII